MISTDVYIQMGIRLVVTLVLCGMVGLQRALAGKAAGVRTHIMVGVGSALMTLASAYAFPGWPGPAHDPTRIAAQIVSGIGFIGGGMILKDGNSVRGLTTAASLWAVAGIGIAVGADLIPLAVMATILMLATLSLLGRVDTLIPQQRRTIWQLSFNLADTEKLHGIYALLKTHCPVLHLIGYETSEAGGLARVSFELATPRHFDIVQASALLAAHGAAEPRWKADSFGEELA
jgi:putative Mg2+ transporter-C (MgtC) family protein